MNWVTTTVLPVFTPVKRRIVLKVDNADLSLTQECTAASSGGKEVIPMEIDILHKRESEQLPIAVPGEDTFSGLGAAPVEIIALGLWQRGCYLGTLGDDCSLCKGEAQQCLAICQ